MKYYTKKELEETSRLGLRSAAKDLGMPYNYVCFLSYEDLIGQILVEQKEHKARKTFQKGQFYAAKYKGTGGDVILGQVQSVMTNIMLDNLLSGKTSMKKASVLKIRNKRVSKSQANKILAAFKRNGREAARKAAIAAPEFRNGKNEPEQPSLLIPEKPTESKIVKEYNTMVNKCSADVKNIMAKFRDDFSALLHKYGMA